MIIFEDKLSKELLEENFQLEQLTSGLQYPKILIEAINSKNEAVQKSQKAENELAIVKAEAQKKVIAAQAEYVVIAMMVIGFIWKNITVYDYNQTSAGPRYYP